MEQKRLRIVFLLSVIVLLVLGTFILNHVEVERVRPTTIEVVVSENTYRVGSTDSDSLIDLVKKYKSLRGNEAQIVLLFDKDVSTQRVQKTIEDLGAHGYDNPAVGINE